MFPAPTLKQISGTRGRVKLPGLGVRARSAGLLAMEGSFCGLRGQREKKKSLYMVGMKGLIYFITTALACVCSCSSVCPYPFVGTEE